MLDRKRGKRFWSNPHEHKFRIAIAVLVLAQCIVVTLLITLKTGSPSALETGGSLAPGIGRPLKLVSRNVIGKEGIGSAMQDIKMTLVLAAIMEADLEVPAVESEHGYNAASYLMRQGTETVVTNSVEKVCRVADFLSPRSLFDELGSACETAAAFKRVSAKFKKLFRGCTTLVDVTEKQKRMENCNACIAEWVRDRLITSDGVVGERTSGDGIVRVLYHNRAGDMGAGDQTNRTNHRVLRPPDALRAMNDIANRESNSTIKLIILSEDKDLQHYKALKDYRYVFANGSDWFEELNDIGTVDYAVLGEGSFSVLAAQTSGAPVLYVKDSHTKKFGEFPNFGVDVRLISRLK